MMTDCSLNYKFNTWKFQTQTWGEHVVYRNCFWHSEQHVIPIFCKKTSFWQRCTCTTYLQCAILLPYDILLPKIPKIPYSAYLPNQPKQQNQQKTLIWCNLINSGSHLTFSNMGMNKLKKNFDLCIYKLIWCMYYQKLNSVL